MEKNIWWATHKKTILPDRISLGICTTQVMPPTFSGGNRETDLMWCQGMSDRQTLASQALLHNSLPYLSETVCQKRTHTHTFTHRCARTHTHTHTHTRGNTYTHAYKYTYTHIRTHMHMYTQTHIYTRTHTSMHTLAYIYTHTHTHTHIYTHKFTQYTRIAFGKKSAPGQKAMHVLLRFSLFCSPLLCLYLSNHIPLCCRQLPLVVYR